MKKTVAQQDVELKFNCLLPQKQLQGQAQQSNDIVNSCSFFLCAADTALPMCYSMQSQDKHFTVNRLQYIWPS